MLAISSVVGEWNPLSGWCAPFLKWVEFRELAAALVITRDFRVFEFGLWIPIRWTVAAGWNSKWIKALKYWINVLNNLLNASSGLYLPSQAVCRWLSALVQFGFWNLRLVFSWRVFCRKVWCKVFWCKVFWWKIFCWSLPSGVLCLSLPEVLCRNLLQQSSNRRVWCIFDVPAVYWGRCVGLRSSDLPLKIASDGGLCVQMNRNPPNGNPDD